MTHQVAAENVFITHKKQSRYSDWLWAGRPRDRSSSFLRVIHTASMDIRGSFFGTWFYTFTPPYAFMA
jgi:hypothetical protein